jgi:hypothetical protein
MNTVYIARPSMDALGTDIFDKVFLPTSSPEISPYDSFFFVGNHKTKFTDKTTYSCRTKQEYRMERILWFPKISTKISTEVTGMLAGKYRPCPASGVICVRK